MEALAPEQGEQEAPFGGRALVFVGFMGAGKSSAARSVAAELGVEPVDSDRELERELGEPIERVFDREGEEAFRAREEDLVLRLLRREDLQVAALGGGALASEKVRVALERHVVVHLDVDPAEAWRRASGKGRPLARDVERFDALYQDRRHVYEAAADALLPPADRGLPARALPALLALREAPVGTRLAWALSASGDYPVFFGRGLLETGFFYPADGGRFVVSDENVARLHRVPGEWRFTFEPGEREKHLGTAERLLREMARDGVGREDLLVALGGGVVGDVGGFCAAVYQRGIRHVQVPTSLVAQVDSAYGGKTGVDLPEGKNYAGAYHQPSAVLVDPRALDTLPEEERTAGYAEVVKTALIAGGPLWARVRDGGEPNDDTILGCLRAKLAVVAADERDAGRRQVLNLGHTVGHAIEAATDYARYRHGEAVAIGLLAALRLSANERLRDEVSELLAARGLPLSFGGTSVERVLELIERDKKRRGGVVPFVLVEAPGAVTPGHELPAEAVRAAVEEVHEG